MNAPHAPSIAIADRRDPGGVRRATIAGKFIASAEGVPRQERIHGRDHRAQECPARGARQCARLASSSASALLAPGDPAAPRPRSARRWTLKYPPDEVYPAARARAGRAGRVQEGDRRSSAERRCRARMRRREVRREPARWRILALGERPRTRSARSMRRSRSSRRTSMRCVAQAQLAGARAATCRGAGSAVDAVLAAHAGQRRSADVERRARDGAGQARRRRSQRCERAVDAQPGLVRAALLRWSSNCIQARQLDKAAAQVDALKKLRPHDPRTLYADRAASRSRAATTPRRSRRCRSRSRSRRTTCRRAISPASSTCSSAHMPPPRSRCARCVAQAPGRRRCRAWRWRRRQPAPRPGGAGAGDAGAGAARAPDNPGAAARWPARSQLAPASPTKAAELLRARQCARQGQMAGKVRLAQVRLAAGRTGAGVQGPRIAVQRATRAPVRRISR